MNPLFLQLIQPLSLSCPIAISRHDFDEVREQGMRHNLFQLVYTQIQRYHGQFSPQALADDFLLEMKGIYLKGVQLSAQQEATENEITSLLNARGIASLVIKGNSLAKEIYNDPNCRTSSDIDILIKESDVLRADKVLQENRYVRNDRLSLQFWLHRIHHAIYYHPETNGVMEIHWNFGIPSFFRLSSDEIWREVIIHDSGVMGLSPRMLLIMLLMHHHMHAFRELKILVDILWAFHIYEHVIDRTEFIQKLRQIGLIKTAKITLSQIKNIWGNTICQLSIIDFLYQELKNIRKGNRMLPSFFPIDTDACHHPGIVRDKILPRFALDDTQAIMGSYLKLFFPSPEVIRQLYGTRQKSRLPMHYMKFIRWRIKEWTGI